MSVNRFTNLRSREYVNSYVPLPINLMYQGLANKQKEFDANIDDVRATQELIKINADPHREGIRDQLLQKYNNEINTLTDEYLKGGDASIMSKVNRLKRDFANDQTRLGLEKSAANYSKYQTDIKKLKDEGNYVEGIGGYDAYNQDAAFDKEGKFTSFNYEGQLARQDYRTTGQSLISDIAKDSKSWDGIKVDKATNMPDIGAYGQYWKSGHSKSGLGVPKILEMAEKNAENLINTKEGVWFVDDILNKAQPGIGHVNYNTLPDNYKEYVKKKATDYLYSLGAKQRGFDIKDSNDLRMLSDGQLDRLKAPEVNSGTMYPGDVWHDKQAVSGAEVDKLLNDDGTLNKSAVTQAKGGNLTPWQNAMNQWGQAISWLDGEKYTPKYKESTEADFNAAAKNMLDIAKVRGWDKDDKGQPLTKGQTLQRTAAALNLLSVGSDSNYRPPSNVKEDEVVKRLEWEKAVDKDGVSLHDAINSSGSTIKDSQVGFVFGGDAPKIQIKMKDGAAKDYNITNTSYKDYLNNINNVVKTNNDVIKRKAYTNKAEMTEGYGLLLDLKKSNPEALNNLQSNLRVTEGNGTMDSNLKPISIKNYKGGLVYSYSDANEPGAIRIIYELPDRSFQSFPTQSDFIQQESGAFFENPETVVENQKFTEKKHITK